MEEVNLLDHKGGIMKRFSNSAVPALLVLALSAIMASCGGGGGGGGSATTTPSFTDTIAPTVPTNLTASAISASQIDLSWAGSTDDTGVAGYEVWQEGARIATATTTTCSATGLAAGASYTYTVKAFDSAGNVSAASSPASATTANTTADTTVPTIPSGLKTTATSTSQISLAWNVSTDAAGVTGYKVYRDGTYLNSVITISALDSGLTASTQYCYQVSAYDAANNESGRSSQSCAITSAPTTTAAPGVYRKLPDTNQTVSYSFTFGEDSDYTINPPSYTDNGTTITDNITGLVWQKQDDDLERNWADASTFCNTLSLGGLTGWRLPTRMELISIIDYGTFSPAINTAYFPSTVSSPYWSSTTKAGGAMFADFVHFADGTAGDYDKSGTIGYTRCVQGGSSATQSLTDNGNGTVTDSSTHLMWQQGESVAMIWEDALTYCEGSTLAGYSDWRLPNHKELLSLVDETSTNPSINTAMFPGVFPQYYWTSTTLTSYTFNVLNVSFVTGYAARYNKTTPFPARCVRGGL